MRRDRPALASLVAALACVLLTLAPPAARADAPGAGARDAGDDFTTVDDLPAVTRRVEPVYPPQALETGVTGTVLIELIVDRHGRVRHPRVVESIPLLDGAALDAVRQWRFEPARIGSQPVESRVRVPVEFRIDGRSEGGRPRPGPRIRGDGHGRGASGGMPLLGEYFIGADSTDRVVVVTSGIDRARVWLESPGEWLGAGVVRDSVYWGVFVYLDEAREPRNRGARGTHHGRILADGGVSVTGTFSDRDWPPFHVRWTPTAAARTPRRRIDPEDLREIPVVPVPEGRIEHPVWPPERRR